MVGSADNLEKSEEGAEALVLNSQSNHDGETKTEPQSTELSPHSNPGATPANNERGNEENFEGPWRQNMQTIKFVTNCLGEDLIERLMDLGSQVEDRVK